MKIKQPEPFTFEAGSRAVLLLHGFTGHSADVRMLGRYLQKKGYTSHAPIYRGHGVSPEELIKTSPDDWWEDVLQAYHHVKDLGYDEIAVAGLSMGGALGLKLANCEKVKATIPMCTPMFFDNKTQLTKGFHFFAKQYKQFEKKDATIIERELNQLMEHSTNMFKQIGAFIKEVHDIVDMVYTPTMVVQARKDGMINPESANYIYENVATDDKIIKWYEHSGHVITLDKEKDVLHEDIYTFLESLNWEQ
ncbi:alpha/beta hydrolase [Pseudogracilibacillus auburnensis]|uniref:Esterase/lipase n=1 Tax=Pseudogracilibacillus auburnensis TaxID=1494959 RepID=A0A2V3VWU0_9BACI|nr:carboxylesterase [Pseudogracilibacillus auburnensis]MBO1005796.1 carboxylesterase [Pseudogracilibacillus auburnensis]PXW81009.1 esterase/lipase [Pseudogracilibacillus auburnensis]